MLAYYVDAVRQAAEGEGAAQGGSSRPGPQAPEEGDRLPALPQGVDTATAADLVRPASSRVQNACSFAAWVGLTPSEHSSGESDPRGAITRPATST